MEIAYEIEIDRPPAAVWEWLHDPEKQKQWMKGLISNEVTSGDGKSVGSTFLMKIKEGGRETPYEGTIQVWETHRRLDVTLVGGCGKTPMTMDVAYNLTPRGSSGTHLSYVARSEASGCLMTTLGWLFKIIGKRMVKSFFRRLKQGCEAEAL